MSNFTTAIIVFIALLLCLDYFHLVFCKNKAWGGKGIKKLPKSEVEVKTYLFPCSYDKDIINSTFGPNRPHIHNCKRKFVIRMRVNSGGEFCSKTDGFIPIDHVIDGITGRKKRLLNPLMVRLKRENMYQLYDLQLVKSVNAEAREEVINYENTPNYTGCDTSSSHPTCGFSFFNNKIIQFSEGFCCSCNENKNEQRQPCESHFHESKDFQDMEYAVHRRRSNRTSRGLDTGHQKRETLVFDSGSGKELVSNQFMDSAKLSPAVAKLLGELNSIKESNGVKSNVDFDKSQNQRNTVAKPSGLPIDTCEDFQPLLNSDIWNNNVTVKSFEFEHSTDKSIEYLFSDSPMNILIDTEGEIVKLDNQEKKEIKNDTSIHDKPIFSTVMKLDDSEFNHLINTGGDLNEYFDTVKHSDIANNLVDPETFKRLVMKRVKENKNHEKTLMDGDISLTETTNLPSNKNSRDLKVKTNCSAVQRFDYDKKNGKNGFSLKLENDNSELRLQIITKKPKKGRIAKTKGGSCKPLNQSMSAEYQNTNLSSSGLQDGVPLGGRTTSNSSSDYTPIGNITETNKTETSTTEQTTNSGVKQHINPVFKYFKSSKNKKTTTSKNPKCLNTTCNATKSTLAADQDGKTTEGIKLTSTSPATTHSQNDSDSLFLSSASNLTKLNDIDINKCNVTTNTTNIESMMFKLVPVINSVQDVKNAECNDKKTDGVVGDIDNTTYNVYIELRKKSSNEKGNKMNKKNHQESESFVRDYPSGENVEIPDFPIYPVSVRHQFKKNKLESNRLPESLLHDIHAQNIQKREAGCDFQSRGGQKCSNQGKVIPCNANPESLLHDIHAQNIQKREAGCDFQNRGGQKCSNQGKVIPCNANPETYFESAHCLRFSDLWYNVFKLLNPRLENSITVKVYARHKTPDKRICWENLSKRLPGRVGTVNEVLIDDVKNIMISYSSDDKVAFNLDCVNDYILVPQPLPRYCKDGELKDISYGGPEEYLVLKDNEITFDGEECDKAGVNYAAFARQLHRCQQDKGTCLKNQPLHYWRQDKELEKDGKKGQYFLNNFLEVTEQAILQNTTSNQVVLRAPYVDRYQSHIVIELNADHIEIIGDKTAGQITEVYTDATSDKVTVVKTVVTNLGVAADFFAIDFSNCSSRLGPSDFDKPNRDEIPPQHRITYTATISSPLKTKKIECKMILYNLDQEVVASRHIIIVQGHRCMCVWYCQCVCYNYPDPGLPCNPLTVRDYNRAGFPGHLPVTIGSDCSMLFTVLHALLWFFLFLILFGLMKAILGLCFCVIALWGLWYLLPDEAKCLTSYLEPDLVCYPVIRDCDGFPIHPRTYRRSDIHFLPWYTEFVVNVFFFICVFRTCLCDHGSYRSNDSCHYFQNPGCYQNPRPQGRTTCPPRYSSRRKSPCDSVCSKKRNRKFRVSAGADEDFLNPDPQILKDDEWAKHLVDELTRSYVVFRVLSRPMGGVKSVPGTPYCVRGFFLESENGVYEFTPPSPLMQIWQMDGNPMDPPLRLDPSPFHALYRSAHEVLAAHEYSPWARGVVINAP